MVNIKFLRVSIVLTAEAVRDYQIATRLTSKHVTSEEATPDQRARAMGNTPQEAHH
jgi:hypothetical protein